jgi:hypothetical protein
MHFCLPAIGPLIRRGPSRQLGFMLLTTLVLAFPWLYFFDTTVLSVAHGNISPPTYCRALLSSPPLSKTWTFQGGEARRWRRRVLQNVGICLQVHTTSQPRRRTSSVCYSFKYYLRSGIYGPWLSFKNFSLYIGIEESDQLHKRLGSRHSDKWRTEIIVIQGCIISKQFNSYFKPSLLWIIYL